MTTRKIDISSKDSLSYIKITEKDAVIQNNSSYLMRVVYSDVLPPQETKDFHPLRANEYIIKKDGVPEGCVFIRLDSPDRVGCISITESSILSTSEVLSNLQTQLIADYPIRLLDEIKLLRAITEETFQTSLTKDDIKE